MKEQSKNNVEKIREIAKIYILSCQLVIKDGQDPLIMDSVKRKGTLDWVSKIAQGSDSMKLVTRTNIVFQALLPEEREIIYKCFFFPDGRNWWKSKYSRSTFYRNKEKAINHFIEMYAL
ncbi:MAG: hypothetical protein J6I69_02605 [Bacilli bacterium]|nr:hypothetical protein [Bacilli bacterium]